jgi:phosphatidylglycerophosphate synthase/putative flippase GtrA
MTGSILTNPEWGLSLLPTGLAASYFLGGMAVYALRTAFSGEYFDRELSTRSSSPVMGRWIRMYWAWITRPFWHAVSRANVPANALTTLSLLFSACAAVLLATDHLALGGWMVVLAGILDFLDGRLARERGEASKHGAALDSVLDRFSDAAVLMGLAWLYRSTWVLFAVLLAIVGSLLISYVRARGEGLGVSIKSGLMQRPERIALLGTSLIVSPLVDGFYSTQLLHPLLVVVLVVLAVSTQLTALSRLRVLLQALDERPAFSWKALLGRASISRALLASLVATAADFLFVVGLVDWLGLRPSIATALGCLLGGVINFSLGRVWVFQSRRCAAMPQAMRYAFVSASSAGLNAVTVAILVLTAVDYRLAWLLARVAVFLGWNYPLQRDFVFSERASVEERASEPAPLPLMETSKEQRELGNPLRKLS